MSVAEPTHLTGQGSTALSRPPRVSLARRLRNVVLQGASWVGPRGDVPLPEVRALRRVLLVYVNFRLGNTIAATPAVSALVKGLPDAEIDFLGGPAARAVFQGFGLRRVLTMSRHAWWNPIAFVPFYRTLRRERYDAAIYVGTATASIGAWACRLSGAPVRIGCRRASGNIYFTSTVPAPAPTAHKVDRLHQYVRSLGIPADGRRRLVVAPDEAARARRLLGASGRGTRRVAVFLSGRVRKGKGWDLSFFRVLVDRLRSHGAEPVVVLGPEEQRRARPIRAQLGRATYIRREDLRIVAAVVAACDAAVVPDSGPMHLAIAVGTPTVALFRNTDAWKWGPCDGEGAVVHDPEGRDVEAALAALRGVLRNSSRAYATTL